MKAKKITVGFVLVLVAVAVLFLAAHKSLEAQMHNPGDEVYTKLDRILEIEEQILKEISLLKEKLDFIERQTNKL